MLAFLIPSLNQMVAPLLLNMKVSKDLYMILVFFAVVCSVFFTFLNLFIYTYIVYLLIRLDRTKVSVPFSLRIVLLMSIPMAIKSVFIGIRSMFEPGYIPSLKIISNTGVINYWMVFDPFVIWSTALFGVALFTCFQKSVFKSMVMSIALYVMTLSFNLVTALFI
jgi:hypothetical protein